MNDGAQKANALSVLLDIEMPLILRFGRSQLLLEDILELDAGASIELDRSPEEPVEVVVNGRVVARGEVVEVQGNYGIRISEIVSRRERLDTTASLAALASQQD